MRLHDTVKALRASREGCTDNGLRDLLEAALFHLVHQKRVNKKIRKELKK
jgi:hypothetical protein